MKNNLKNSNPSTLNVANSKPKNIVSEGVKFTSLHHIDHSTGIITFVDIDSKSVALHEYIERLLNDIKEKSSKRSFEFRSKTTEVRAAIDLLIQEKYLEAVDINAIRLLKVEQEAQLDMNKLAISIQKGSLFQTVINVDNDTKMIIIGKADHNDFLDASDFVVHKGLPWKKRIFKSFLAITDFSGNIRKVFISDTTNVITKYWWSDFFELSEVRTDKYNTKNFIEILDKKVFNPIKKSFPADHTTLRNSVIGHFHAYSDFDLDRLYDTIFKDYSVIDKKFPIEDIKKKIKEIPEKYNLDSQFSIDKEEINIRAVNKIFLNEGIELVLKGSPDLDNITAFKNDEGDKFIAIKTDEGYSRFKKS